MARITRQDAIKLQRPRTIGDMERLAGIGSDEKSRADFWRQYYKPMHDFTADGMADLRGMVKARIRNNELCLV